MCDIIDGYCHCGLSKYRPVEYLREVMRRNGVLRAVLVQHLGEYDNGYIEYIVTNEPQKFAGVMLINVQSPSADKDLAAWAGRKAFRGIRLLAHTAATHPDIWERAAEVGLNIVVYESPTIAAYVDLIRRFASRHAGTRIVISHLGVLDGREAPGYPSIRHLLDLAEEPNVFIQLSGFHMFGSFPYLELAPIVEMLLAGFGPERSLYGSNFPVMGNDEVYNKELVLLSSGRFGVPANALEDVLSRTAKRLWFDRQAESAD